MKKISTVVLIFLLSCIVFVLGFENKKSDIPNTYYQVYLDDQILGTIKSKKKLVQYIDKRGKDIKEKYGVSNVYAPDGLDIRKIVTYNAKISTEKQVYEKLSKLKPFTISGYQFIIKKEVEQSDGSTTFENKTIYVVDDSMFNEAIRNTIITFIGEETYDKYLEGTQTEIKETGLIYNDIYVDDIITKKQTRISVDEKIYTDVEDLSQYILFSTTDNKKEYVTKSGDTIETVASKNKISVQEFMVSNPEFTSKDNILYAGQVVSVAYANPIIDVMASVTKVEDQTKYYNVEERMSSELISGNEEIIQQGENGINRVTQEIVYKNGFIEKAEVNQQVVIKPVTSKIVLVGTRYASGIGSGYWTWPTTSYSISSNFGYRSGAFHTGLDIYNYYGAPIYAANNGIVTTAGWYGTYGLFVGINHNNGYGTGYGHMSAIAPSIKAGSIVERGQLIGYIGMTGRTSGPHVHFEVYYGASHPGYKIGSFFNPQVLY